MICSSVCLLRFIVWSFLKARLLFVLDQFNGATSAPTRSTGPWNPDTKGRLIRLRPTKGTLSCGATRTWEALVSWPSRGLSLGRYSREFQPVTGATGAVCQVIKTR